MNFEIEILKQNNISYISIKGYLDCTVCKIMESKIKEHMYKKNFYLIFLMKDVHKLSKLSIGVLYKIFEDCKSIGGYCILVVPKSDIFTNFRSPFFEILNTKEEATRKLENIMFR